MPVLHHVQFATAQLKWPFSLQRLQVLGRNLEATVNRAMALQEQWGDNFVSVEHLLLGLAEDSRCVRVPLREYLSLSIALCKALSCVLCNDTTCFPRAILAPSKTIPFPVFRCVESLLKGEGLTKQTLEDAAKEIRGSNKVQDQDPEGACQSMASFVVAVLVLWIRYWAASVALTSRASFSGPS